jgi:hypothetical protein
MGSQLETLLRQIQSHAREWDVAATSRLLTELSEVLGRSPQLWEHPDFGTAMRLLLQRQTDGDWLALADDVQCLWIPMIEAVFGLGDRGHPPHA